MNLLMELHLDVIKMLLDANVEFIVIGGYSVIFHGGSWTFKVIYLVWTMSVAASYGIVRSRPTGLGWCGLGWAGVIHHLDKLLN